ncbi:hypothetical protein ACF0H5_000992 [Mactra antiquata]
MVIQQYTTMCLLLCLEVLITIISYNGIYSMPAAIKPIYLQENTQFRDLVQPVVNDNGIIKPNTDNSVLDRAGKTDAQNVHLVKPNIVNIHKSNDNNGHTPYVHNSQSGVLTEELPSGKTINSQMKPLNNIDNKPEIPELGVPELGKSKDKIAQIVLEKLLSVLFNQSKSSTFNVTNKNNDLYTVHSSKKRAVNSRQQGDRTVQLAVVQGENLHANNPANGPEEMITSVMALVVLCSIGIVGGVFGCCCPKKKESVDEVKDSNITNDNGVKATQDIPMEVNTSDNLTANVDLDDRVSVKEKAKALDNMLILQPSPSNRSPSNRRSKSLATPDSPKSKRLSQRSPDRHEDRRSKNLDLNIDSEMSRSIVDSITDTPDDITDNLSMYSSTISQGNNPDVVIADSDEDDQFAEIQRGTKILKSFQRAKPPRNRSPATRTPKGKIRKHRQTQPDESKIESSKDQEPASQSANIQLGTSTSKSNSLDYSEPDQDRSVTSKTNSLDKSIGSIDVLDATSESPLLKSSDISDFDSDMATSVTSISSDIVTPTKRKGKCAKNKDRKIITADVVMNKTRDITDERSELSKRYEPKVESPLAKRKNGGKKSNGLEVTQKRSSKVMNEDNEQNGSNTKRLSGVPPTASNNIFYLIDPTVKDKCKSVGDVTKSEDKKTEESEAKKKKVESPEGKEVCI